MLLEPTPHTPTSQPDELGATLSVAPEGHSESVVSVAAQAPTKVSALRAFGTHRGRRDFEGKIDTRRRRHLRDEARALPKTPGVYFFYGFNNRLLYIGKAKNLRNRVRSYFAETKLQRPPKLRRLLAEIERLEVRHCGSELEALLLERCLIAEYRPTLNRALKRFEIYPYLLLSDEAFPRLTLTRAEPLDHAETEELDAEDENDLFAVPTGEASRSSVTNVVANAPLRTPHSTMPLETPPHVGELPGLYLGPFTTPRAAWWTLEAVRNLFPLRSCEGDLKPDPNGRACFYFDIGRCTGPCIGASSEASYRQLCDDLLALLHSGQAPQLDNLRARMNQLADEWRFEDAAKIKEQIEAIEIVAARLHRLTRMREENNVIITQPALREADGSTLSADGSTLRPALASVFLVRGGVVRRHILVSDESNQWESLKRDIHELFSAPPPATPFTAKAELDEMMILDRWLQAHGKEGCCAWLNPRDRVSRTWVSNAVRKIQKCARATCNG
ncbi:MAG: excinuclease subunit [Abditibacteriota bacterium]|nr:excinuclease subunit [Abditibacteriota bacterium]